MWPFGGVVGSLQAWHGSKRRALFLYAFGMENPRRTCLPEFCVELMDEAFGELRSVNVLLMTGITDHKCQVSILCIHLLDDGPTVKHPLSGTHST